VFNLLTVLVFFHICDALILHLFNFIRGNLEILSAMIRISCSKLEDVRRSPLTFVKQLKEKKKSGGKHGMLQYWQDCARASHTGQLQVPDAIKKLRQNFLSFSENAKNKKRQEFLIDRFAPYMEDFKTMNYTYIGAQKSIEWNMISDVYLTGYTPNLVSNDGGFASYFYTEHPISWQEQLKFPLIQHYLAEEIFKCTTQDVEVGTYCLSTLSFSLIKYSEADIEAAIKETRGIFSKIREEYDKES